MSHRLMWLRAARPSTSKLRRASSVITNQFSATRTLGTASSQPIHSPSTRNPLPLSEIATGVPSIFVTKLPMRGVYA